MEQPVPEPAVQRLEQLVTDIETADGNLSSTVRSAYESGDIGKFQELLDVRVRTHDKEIERLCNCHYQGFIDSVRSLLQVRPVVERLKSEIHQTNSSLQSSGHMLKLSGEKLIKKRKTLENIDAAIDTMSMCLPVLEAYSKLREQMNAKRYYPALKTLEQLEHAFIPQVSKYRFAQAMIGSIPKVRENIQKASTSDLQDFLESIRKHSTKIGEVAMRQAAEQNRMDPSLAVRKPQKKRPAPLGPGQLPPGPDLNEQRRNPFDEEEGSEGISAQDLIDFSPVYRCLHIHTVLGARESFERYFRTQRRKQENLALSPPQNMKYKSPAKNNPQNEEQAMYETLDAYKQYFHDIIGFFVVEDHIMNTTSGLVTRGTMDEYWDVALSSIVAKLRVHIGFCTNAELTLQIKTLIMLFCHTLRGYGFSVSQLYDLLLEVRDQYSEILLKKWVDIFNRIFDEDDYTPITVNTELEYQEVLSKFPCKDLPMERTFPKKFPFSFIVPKVFSEVKEYIHACLKFSEDLHLSLTEVDEMIRKLANVLLTRTLGGCLSALMKSPTLGLLQLIQISINMDFLERSCIYLEDFITNITGAGKDSLHVSKLQGTSMFKEARREAEEQIYKQINEKIDEFFELASYDWVMSEAESVPSGYICDLIAFLRSTFQSFTNLPERVAQTACMRGCQHIAMKMSDFLVDNEVKALSQGVLQQLSVDLKRCEDFAASEPIPGMNQGTLKLSFIDLRQLLDLLTRWDWTSYFAEYGKEQSRYLRVSPKNCILLLEKMRVADKTKNNLFSTLKKNERDRKKLFDTVLKQLRQLANAQTNGQT